MSYTSWTNVAGVGGRMHGMLAAYEQKVGSCMHFRCASWTAAWLITPMSLPPHFSCPRCPSALELDTRGMIKDPEFKSRTTP